MMVLITLIARLAPTISESDWLAERKEPLWVDILRWVGMGLFAVHAALLGYAWLRNLQESTLIPWVVASLVLGYATADLLSGIVHWISDTYGSRDAPIYGRLYAIPFRDHHIDPTSLCKENFVESHGINALSASTMLVMAYYLQDFETATTMTMFLAGFALAASIGVLIAGQSHKWAHQAEVPWLVERCQSYGLLAHPHAHALHHSGQHDDHFCIASGWWNEPLARLQFYRRLESLIARLFNITPIR